MADLRNLASNLLGRLGEVNDYVSPQVLIDDRNGERLSGNAEDIFPAAVRPLVDKTNLIFVTASAGVGKTSLLSQMVRGKASAYRAALTDQLWIYVDAQGRRLARLDDAVSGDLGKARARFSFDAVPTLVRVGALVLVVDGFDELLGVAGSYDESFSSLASFLDGLRGGGCVIAAARSAYYEQEFVSRVNSSIGFRTEGWDLTRVQLQDWDVAERAQYVALRTDEADFTRALHDEFNLRLEAVLSDEHLGNLAGNPFFVTRTVESLLASEDSLGDGRNLLEQLVNSYLRRESEEKLRQQTGRPVLSTPQLAALFAEIAEEIWRQDAVELSRSSLRELLSVWGEIEGLDPEAQLLVADRGPYAALLKSGESRGSVRFEHDVYYAYFLSEPVVQIVRSADRFRVRQALRRGQMPELAANLAGVRLASEASSVLSVLSDAGARDDANTPQIRRNAGTVAAGVIKSLQSSEDAMDIRNLDFIDVSFVGVELRSVTLVGCAFINVDLRNCILQGEVRDLTLDRILVDPATTILSLTGIHSEDVRAVSLSGVGINRMVYEPLEVGKIMAACGLLSAQSNAELRAIPDEILTILEELVGVYSRTNFFTEADETGPILRLTSNWDWPKVRELMVKNGVMVKEKRQASGRKEFLRIRLNPALLLIGRDRRAEVPDSVRSLWVDLENEFGTS
ncbi:hypothetical protein [Kribbella sp. CA-294648]|uniref:hypothetical protein n=1 Tax=Kribbella sp. CA-294648 TaxID=3239948 RepID=UPI003D89DEB2